MILIAMDMIALPKVLLIPSEIYSMLWSLSCLGVRHGGYILVCSNDATKTVEEKGVEILQTMRAGGYIKLLLIGYLITKAKVNDHFGFPNLPVALWSLG